MSLYLVLSLTWAVLIVSLIGLVLAWPGLRREIVAAGGAVVLITLLFLVLYGFESPTSFLGLEYEDAFEYIYSGRVLASDPQARNLDLNPVCVAGSREECLSYATLAHPIGLPTLISWPVRLFGLSLSYGHAVSLLFLWLASIGVFALLRLWDVETRYAALGSVFFLSVPICLALGGTSLAEPASAGLITLALVLCEAARRIRYAASLRPKQVRGGWLGAALLAVLVLAIFVKREALSLVLTIPLGYLFVALAASGARSPQRQLGSLKFVAAVCALALAAAWIGGHGGLLDWRSIRPTPEASFSFVNLRRWGADYSAHLFSSRFLFLVPLALVGILLMRSDRRPLVLLPVIAGYIVLFASFSQSFYAERLGEVPYFHFERYTLEIAPLLAVLGGFGVARLGVHAERFLPRSAQLATLFLAGCVAVGVGLAVALPYRRSLASDEANLRRAPIEAVCAKVPTRGWVITDEPILFFLYCKRPVRLIARETLAETADTLGLRRIRAKGELFLWEDLEDRIALVRYGDVGRLLATSRRTTVFRYSDAASSFALFRLRS
jgi:hypothetical protein